jgi:transposase
MSSAIYKRLLARKRELLADKPLRKPRMARPKLTRDQMQQIYQRYEQGESPKALAQEYGVSLSRIYQLVQDTERQTIEVEEDTFEN